MSSTPKTTTDPLGDWFRHICTELSDTDYEEGIRAIAWARDQFHPTRINTTDAEIQAAARAVFETRDDPYDDTEWEELISVDRERWECYARAALVAAREVARHE